jgi:Zn-dependent membrane protease YugP
MTVRRALVPATRIYSGLSLPLAFLGIFLEFTPLIYAGIILFAVTTLFELVTLPVELDASKRAMRVLKDFGYLDSDELGGVRKVLTSAAMTYLASLLVSVASLLRLVFLADRRDRRR